MLPFDHLSEIQESDEVLGAPLHPGGLEQLHHSNLDGIFLWALRCGGFTFRLHGMVFVPLAAAGWVYVMAALVTSWSIAWTLSALVPLITSIIACVCGAAPLRAHSSLANPKSIHTRAHAHHTDFSNK